MSAPTRFKPLLKRFIGICCRCPKFGFFWRTIQARAKRLWRVCSSKNCWCGGNWNGCWLSRPAVWRGNGNKMRWKLSSICRFSWSIGRCFLRTPTDVSADNEGYDIRSVNTLQIKRYIEVKGRSGSDGSIMMSENEWNRLKQLGDAVWLYIVVILKWKWFSD